MERKNPFKTMLGVAGWYFLMPALNLLVLLAAIAAVRLVGRTPLFSPLTAAEDTLLFEFNNLLMVVTYGLILLVILLFARRSGQAFGQYTGLKQPLGGWRPAILCLAAGIAANFWFSLVLNSGVFPSDMLESYGESFELIQGGSLVLEVIAVVLLAPLVEEMLFRGLILSRLKDIVPLGAAMVVQGFMFGALHGDPLWVVYATVLGTIIGYIRVRMGSLKGVILFHLAFNGAGYLFDSLSERYWDSLWYFPVVLLLSGGVFLGILIWMSGQPKKLV